jgi:hypothetical protein
MPPRTPTSAEASATEARLMTYGRRRLAHGLEDAAAYNCGWHEYPARQTTDYVYCLRCTNRQTDPDGAARLVVNCPSCKRSGSLILALGAIVPGTTHARLQELAETKLRGVTETTYGGKPLSVRTLKLTRELDPT